ncbi:hypothetical protein J2792_003800 [Novosphingobium capsulatum]|uniref:Uncharacterized protein n=1 Tax=Novosphingobium capsulatum TaxID=13688 RepID=A0ABU1MS94_9SPHN|nr:hypothetical protein [Novosphingobium capsulatum]
MVLGFWRDGKPGAGAGTDTEQKKGPAVASQAFGSLGEDA